MKRYLDVAALAAAVALLMLLPHGGDWSNVLRGTLAVFLVWRLWRRPGSWLDAVLGGYVAVLVFALMLVIRDGFRDTDPAFKPRARFVLPNVVVEPTSRFEEKHNVVLIVVEQKRGENGRVKEYKTHRFDARLRERLVTNRLPTDVEVSIERGADDANLLEFARVVAAASEIHVKEVPPDR